VEVRLLGPLEVTHAGRNLVVGGGRQRALLALLALHPNEVVPAERLIDQLWGEQPPATASKGLQVQVSRLRKDLAHNGSDSVLLTGANGYVLQVSPDQIDIHRFERTLDEGTRALNDGEPGRAAERLRDALALWRGPPLADFAYEAFAQQEIARLEELRLVAIEHRIEAELALGRHHRVVPELEGLVAEEPLRERVTWLLMLALYRCGRRADALAVYRRGRRAMVDELGLELGPALRELETAILADAPELAAPAAAPPTAATDARPATRRPPPRAAFALVGVAAALAVALLVVLVRDSGRRVAPPAAVVLDLAPNSVAVVDRARGSPTKAAELPGAPVGVVAADDDVGVGTVDSTTLSVYDGTSGSNVRTVALDLTPGAIAADGDTIWVAAASRGVLLRFKAGYEEPLQRIRWARRATGNPAIAVGDGALWVTDGSTSLARIDPRTERVRWIEADRQLNGVTVGADAAWAFSSKRPGVVRVDLESGNVTPISTVSRPGSATAAPIDIAATADFIWLLNANTGTVTAIDAQALAVERTISIGIDRAPADMTAAGDVVWVANGDGTLSSITDVHEDPASLWVGESLSGVAATSDGLWVTTRAIDKTIPGGDT
jgi:DNA-binding SARP family transcriptional activator